jgi:hypothetical protein
MKDSGTNQSVQGSWRGHYSYASGNDSFGFEAVFLESKGYVEGNILDDGNLGEATATGSFTCPKLEFVKIYRSAGAAPIRYRGILSDEGKLLSGTWRISPKIYGTWIAKRFDDSQELKFNLEQAQEQKQQQLVETTTAKRKPGRRK